MNYQYIEIDNCKIAFIEKNRDSLKTLFFIHGNSCSTRLWYKQLDHPVLSDYRLICIDLPGHGRSGIIEHEKDNNLLFLGDLLSRSIKALANDNEYILVGFSLGANIVAEMMPHSLDTSGIVIISPTIVGGAYTFNDTLKEGADPGILFMDEPFQNDIECFMHEIFSSYNEADFLICVEDFNSVKKPFRSMILKTAIEGKLSDEIMNLNLSGIPVLTVFGKDDNIVNPDYLDEAPLRLWNAKIFKIDNAGHYAVLDQPEAFVALLADYCGQMFK